MQCDIQLWKKLRELNASLVVLKEDILQQKIYRARSDSLSSASSGTDSFVSAEEYNDVIFTDTSENRVLSWINQSDFGGKEKGENVPGTVSVNYVPRSPTCSDPERNRKWIFRDHLHNSCISETLIKNCRILNSVANSVHTYLGSANDLQDVFYSYSLDPFLINLQKANMMKCTEETEIISRRDFTYYKSSLRLLGSVRMQSRIFEPSLTKWRPFALSQTPDSYIIVPPKAFSSIQPRPKLHRLANIFESGTLFLHTVTNDAKEVDDRDKTKIEEKENRENLEETGKSETSLSAEHVGNEPNLERSQSESDDETTGDCNGYKHDTKRVSEFDIYSFSSDFLEMEDGFITCRIMTPDMEQELKQAVLQQDEFEYLTIVDGRVTFAPHAKDTDNEESYFLGWLFENKEFENVDESFYINRLFEETDDQEIDENMDDFNLISCLLKDIQLESGTMSEEIINSYNESELFHDMDVDTVLPNHKCTDSFLASQLVNEEGDEKLLEDRDTKAHHLEDVALNTVASGLPQHLENEIEHQNNKYSCDQTDE
ncbi:uncharacterized protein LOC123523465 [Mercenaria mercenaria]|uniref:uncharacterized protein LOC123523465 n=1 Tax=Mercenaria mercenaria TaxID=6596 RepID=UPI00234ECAC2|nr:uncharacterized protein LOC123523465 [Mercenaria mercenaria]